MIGRPARAEGGKLAGCCWCPLSSMGSPAFHAARASTFAPVSKFGPWSLTSAVPAPCMQHNMACLPDAHKVADVLCDTSCISIPGVNMGSSVSLSTSLVLSKHARR